MARAAGGRHAEARRVLARHRVDGQGVAGTAMQLQQSADRLTLAVRKRRCRP